MVNNIYILWNKTIEIVPIDKPYNINAGKTKLSFFKSFKILISITQLQIKAIIFTIKAE